MRTAVMVILLCLAAVAQADKVWTVGALGGDDYLAGRVGVRPAEPEGRSWIGLQFSGQEDSEGMDTLGLAAVGTWDLVHEYPVPITLPFDAGQVELVTTVYTGAVIGGLRVEETGGGHDYDATAALLVGLAWGDEKVKFCVEWQRAFTAADWDQLADIDDSRFVIGLAYQF